MRSLYTIEYEKKGTFPDKAYKFVVADSLNDVVLWFEKNHPEKLISVKQTYSDVIVLAESNPLEDANGSTKISY